MDYHLLRFRWSLQALAAPAKVQLQLFPDFVWKVDEMAIEFEQWYEVMKRRQHFFSPTQSRILKELNHRLDEISGPENSQYWLEKALLTNIVWEEIRLIAKRALRAFGWALEKPPKKRETILTKHA